MGASASLAAVLLLPHLLLSLDMARFFFSLAPASSNKPMASSSVVASRIVPATAVVDLDLFGSAAGPGFAVGGKEEALAQDARWTSFGSRRLPFFKLA